MHLTVCMQIHPQLISYDIERVQILLAGLLRHVIGDSQRVVGDPLCVVGDILVLCHKKAIALLNDFLSK